MTHQEKINYLNQYRFILREASRLNEQLLRLKSERERITPIYSAVKGSSHDGNRIERLTEKIMEIESHLWDKRFDCITFLETIEKVIDSMTDEREKQILRLRYIEGYKLEQIALAVYCSYRHLTRLHSKIIKKMSLNVL